MQEEYPLKFLQQKKESFSGQEVKSEIILFVSIYDLYLLTLLIALQFMCL